MAGTKSTASNSNLRFYEVLKVVPDEAKKTIQGGRINGMTDISPQWRIGIMTETFGPCGIGWKYVITKQWQEQYGNEVKAFTNIDLYIKVDGEWSDPIPGTGGSTTVEAKGYVSDECYKMSLTDALSVAMKALGVGGEVYFAKGVNFFGTKYEAESQTSAAPQQPTSPRPAAPTAPAAPQPQAPAPQPQAPAPEPQAPAAPPTTFSEAKKEIDQAPTVQALMEVWSKHPELQNVKEFRDACGARRKQIENPNA